jgi:3-hydroxyacyl-CoA dehydrogenase
MGKTISAQTHGHVRLLRMQCPPVNALGANLRIDLLTALREAAEDSAVSALVLMGDGKLFSSGADIAEFGSVMAKPELPELLCEIESQRLPIVAVLNGSALGGGLELALVCDYRFAVSAAKLGLPEVSLGLIPGAGGTQRLPRLIGAEPAIGMITSGKPIGAAEAEQSGLVDRVFANAHEAVAAALDFAANLASERRTARTAASLVLPDDARFAETQTAFVAKQARGREAPLWALESVLNAFALPLDEGLAREQAIFLECAASAQARALQHMFFAERKVAQVKGIGRDVKSRKLEQVAVIGAGTMGSGIATACLQAGLKVTLVDVNPASLERGQQAIGKIIAGNVAKGRISEDKAATTLALLTVADNLEATSSADVIIEAVVENMAVKQQVFAQLDCIAKPGAVLATNTSTLDVNEIAVATQRPDDVIGLHFFSPAHIMRLLEIVRGAQTAPDALKTGLELARRIGKVGVVVGVCYGFVGNRMLEPYSREAHRLLLEGASPAQIDGVLTRFGMAMGVLSMCDMAGNDIGALMRRENHASIAHDPSYCRMGDVLDTRGELGQKSGSGFYAYSGRDKAERGDLPDLIIAEAAALGITRREITDEEIFERCLYSLINEGMRVLEEGVAQRPGDIDTIWCNGYGFPALLGGPMHWAQSHGFRHIHDRLIHWRKALGAYGEAWFSPASSLETLAHNGGSITDLFPSD